MPVYKMPVRLTYGTGSTRGTNTFHFRTTGAAVDQVQIDALVNLVSQFYLAVAGLWGSDSRAIFDGALTEAWSTVSTAIREQFPSGAAFANFRALALRPSSLSGRATMVAAVSLPFASWFSEAPALRAAGD